MIPTASLNDLLNVYFRNGTPPTNLYVGLVDLTSFTGLAAGDTMASHAGWQEFTDYSQSTRPAWAPPAASAGQVQNASLLTFTLTAAGSVKGVFLTTDNTKGGTAGLLVGPELLDNVQVMPIGEDFKLLLTLQAQSG